MTFEKSSRNTLLVGQTWIITTMSWPYYNNNATRSRSSSIHYFNYEFSPPLSSSSFFSFATFQTLMTLQFWPTFGFLQPIDVSHRHRHAQGSTFDTLFENLQYVKIVKNASYFLKFAFAFQAKIFGGFQSLCPDIDSGEIIGQPQQSLTSEKSIFPCQVSFSWSYRNLYLRVILNFRSMPTFC